MADPNQVQQMIMNLMINAANAMFESTSMKKHLWVTLRLHETSNQVELMVADSGPGVSNEAKAKIFEPGFTTRDAGHGFGLATVHRVVSNHQGTVGLEDNPVWRRPLPDLPAGSSTQLRYRPPRSLSRLTVAFETARTPHQRPGLSRSPSWARSLSTEPSTDDPRRTQGVRAGSARARLRPEDGRAIRALVGECFPSYDTERGSACSRV